MTTRKTNKRCFYCEREFGIPPHGSNIPIQKTADHIHPISKGGTWHNLNIVLACNKCNSIKGAKTLEEFEQLIDEWIEEGCQTEKGYSQETLQTIKRKIKKLYHVRNGYKVLFKRITKSN